MDEDDRSPRSGGDEAHTPLSLGWAESLVARRLLRHLEPEIRRLIAEVIRSETAQDLLADTMADVLADLVEPSGAEAGGLAERLLLAMVARYLGRPHFRRAVESLLARSAAGGRPEA